MKILIITAVLLNCSLLLGQYSGTGSVTSGIGAITSSNIYTCAGGRIPSIGTITATDNSIWTVPATVNFNDINFPFASDLHNACTGATYTTANQAINALTGSDIVTIDPSGEIITAYIFADNYFEMYINGVPVGKDNVPYTQFNSNIVRFKVSRPFTISMLLVDWEENLGIGTEINNGFLHHVGDGGMVAVFKDPNNNTLATTGADWKAQTFYTSPVMDLNCPIENGSLRLSNACSTSDSQNGSNYNGLHWTKPVGWMNEAFDDSSWPNATLFTNAEIGVDNKPAYMNFTNIFDDPLKDAQFIWSTNVFLDNEVIVRYTVDQSSGFNDEQNPNTPNLINPNPSSGILDLGKFYTQGENIYITILDIKGNTVYSKNLYQEPINISNLPVGMYFIETNDNNKKTFHKFILE